MENKDFLENEAVLTDNTIRENSCLNCNEDYLFLMKDNYHEFSIGLRTILSALAFAEKEGAVPKLPEDWWSEIKTRY